jgi:hypothetical protein
MEAIIMGIFPRTAPFTYTAISAYVFDQVLTFTNMNTFLGNVDELASAYAVEHLYNSGDGTHARISEGSNLLINPTARQGNAFWYDGGANTDYDNPGVDTDQALAFGAANFGYIHWAQALGSGGGPFWFWNTGLGWGSYVFDLSERIEMGPAQTIVLSGQMFVAAYVAGNFYFDVVCYDSSNQLLAAAGDLNGLCQTKKSATTALATFEATGVTPANTAYIRIRKWFDAAADATGLNIRKLKIESGSTARYFSDESVPTQYLSAKYQITAGSANLSLANDSVEVLDYDQKIFDDPGIDRVTPGAAWVFTADRYMRIRVSASIWLEADTWANGSFFILSVKIPSSAVREIIGLFETTGLVVRRQLLNGSTEIELNAGETFWIEAYQNSGGPINIETAAIVYDGVNHVSNFISIEEI